MKQIRCSVVLYFLAVSILAVLPGRAGNVLWTNTLGGNWSGGANWNPNGGPGPGDTAVLPDVGNSYTVALDVSATVSGLVVGAGSGVRTQTFNNGSPTLTVNGVIQVNSQGIFNLNGGTITGTYGLAGALTCSMNAYLEGTVTVSNNGVINLAGVNEYDYVIFDGTTLTNYGTVNWLNTDNTTLYGGSGIPGVSGTVIYNYGLWNVLSDNYFYGEGYPGGTVFNNLGTLRKSGTTGLTALDGHVAFTNTGTVDAESGTLGFAGGGASSGAGTFYSAGGGSNSVLGNTYTFSSSSNFSGPGGMVLAAGTTVVSGVMTTPNLQLLPGATLTGTNVLEGTLNWSGGILKGTLTVSNNSVLNIAYGGGAEKDMAGLTLTNLGTVNCSNAQIYGGGGAQCFIFNYGLWDAQSNNSLYGGGNNGGTTVIDNFGTFLSTGTNTLDANVLFTNSGTLYAQSGTLNLNTCDLTGGTLNFGISGLTNFGVISLAGSPALTGTLSARLIGLYFPTVGSSFPVLTFSSPSSGAFTNTNLPPVEVWQTTYNPANVTIQVLRSAVALSLVTSPPNIILSWSTNDSAFVLNWTASLAPPIAWTPLTSGITVSGPNNTFTTNTSSAKRFYTLIAP